MPKSQLLTESRVDELITALTRDNDGAYTTELFELVRGVADPENVISDYCLKRLWFLTEDCEKHFQVFKNGRIKV